MIPFVYRGPTDTKAELARYREELLRFLSLALSPDDLASAYMSLPAEHVKRFMLQARELERTETELRQGLHIAQEQAREELATMRALAQAVFDAKSSAEQVRAQMELRKHLRQGQADLQGGKYGTTD